MKIKDEYVLKTISDQFIVVPVGKEAVKFQGMISLNPTAKFLFELLKTEHTKDELIDALVNHYEVSYDVAENDVKSFIETLKKHQLLEQ